MDDLHDVAGALYRIEQVLLTAGEEDLSKSPAVREGPLRIHATIIFEGLVDIADAIREAGRTIAAALRTKEEKGGDA